MPVRTARFIIEKGLFVVVLAAAIVVVQGCGPSGPPPTPPSASAPSMAEVIEEASTWKKTTEEDAREFAQHFAAAVSQGDITTANGMIDWDTIIERVVSGIPADVGFREGFIEGSKKAALSPTGTIGQLSNQLGAEGTYRLLRIREKDNQRTALFRLTMPEGGFNYMECSLVTKPGGQTRIVDIYIFLSGETLTATLRRVYLPAAMGHLQEGLENLSQKERDFVEGFHLFEKIAPAVRRQDFDQVIEICNQMPKSMQEEKSLLILMLRASADANETLYLETLDKLEELYPGDPCLDLLLIDRHILNEQYDEAMASVDRLDKSVGGDPHLNYVKGELYFLQGNNQAAKEMFLKAIEEDGAQPDPYWGMITVSIQMKDFEETTRSLIRLDKNFDMEWDDMTTIKEYDEYVKSPEYQMWLEYLKQ